MKYPVEEEAIKIAKLVNHSSNKVVSGFVREHFTKINQNKPPCSNNSNFDFECEINHNNSFESNPIYSNFPDSISHIVSAYHCPNRVHFTGGALEREPLSPLLELFQYKLWDTMSSLVCNTWYDFYYKTKQITTRSIKENLSWESDNTVEIDETNKSITIYLASNINLGGFCFRLKSSLSGIDIEFVNEKGEQSILSPQPHYNRNNYGVYDAWFSPHRSHDDACIGRWYLEGPTRNKTFKHGFLPQYPLGSIHIPPNKIAELKLDLNPGEPIATIAFGMLTNENHKIQFRNVENERLTLDTLRLSKFFIGESSDPRASIPELNEEEEPSMDPVLPEYDDDNNECQIVINNVLITDQHALESLFDIDDATVTTYIMANPPVVVSDTSSNDDDEDDDIDIEGEDEDIATTAVSHPAPVSPSSSGNDEGIEEDIDLDSNASDTNNNNTTKDTDNDEEDEDIDLNPSKSNPLPNSPSGRISNPCLDTYKRDPFAYTPPHEYLMTLGTSIPIDCDVPLSSLNSLNSLNSLSGKKRSRFDFDNCEGVCTDHHRPSKRTKHTHNNNHNHNVSHDHHRDHSDYEGEFNARTFYTKLHTRTNKVNNRKRKYNWDDSDSFVERKRRRSVFNSRIKRRRC